MTFLGILNSILNPILLPLIDWSPFWGIVILSLLISLLVTLVYKYFTNQSEIKRLREEQKKYQGQLKELRDKPEEMMRIQKEMWKATADSMKYSLKAMLITMIVVLPLFWWMNVHLSYEPIRPGEEFGVTAYFLEGSTGMVQLLADNQTILLTPASQNLSGNTASWKLKGSTGEHNLSIKYNTITQEKPVLISERHEYVEPTIINTSSALAQVQVSQNKLQPLAEVFKGEVSIFGWKPGWLALYFVLSLIFSLGLRKLLKVY